MKLLKRLTVLVIAIAMMVGCMSVLSFAAENTELKSLKVYAVDKNGNRKKVKFDFDSKKDSFDLEVKNNCKTIAIEGVAKDPTSTVVVEKEAVNTKMDTGKNKTIIVVRAANGTVGRYTLNTTKLKAGDDGKKKSSKKSKTVTVDGDKYKIVEDFKKKDIPKGFEKAKVKYDGKEYDGIKGEVKPLKALYLKGDDNKGFFIYNEDKDSFYKMNNIQIKSRMYTIVEPDKVDKFLENYDQKEVKIIDDKVNAWILDEGEQMYLVYAMNWDGDTSLYSYDDIEKNMQRYSVNSDANSQIEAAKEAYNAKQKKYNKLASKYNKMRWIVVLMGVVIVILILLVLHLAIRKREKKQKKAALTTSESLNIAEGNDEEGTADEPEASPEAEEADDDIDTESQAEELETQDETEAQLADDVSKMLDEEKKEKDIPKRKRFGKMPDRPYGDKPTLGTDEESNEGFYGGEVKGEEDVLIDLTDDDPKDSPQGDSASAESAEESSASKSDTMDLGNIHDKEDIKETLKSMLPEEDVDSDDDFEFIDLD